MSDEIEYVRIGSVQDAVVDLSGRAHVMGNPKFNQVGVNDSGNLVFRRVLYVNSGLEVEILYEYETNYAAAHLRIPYSPRLGAQDDHVLWSGKLEAMPNSDGILFLVREWLRWV